MPIPTAYVIEFAYIDEMSNGSWSTQVCTVSSVEECKRIYGLDTDPAIYDYKILSIKPVYI